jgi:hypothetical protein
MKKKIINSAVFFTILYWLVIYLVERKNHFLQNAPLKSWLLLAAGSLLLILFAKILLPVFELVLAVSKRIGSLIFALISALIFFVLLTPISLLMRLFGKTFMNRRFAKEQQTYYELWQISDDVSKQF